jgi:hypothetical protein
MPQTNLGSYEKDEEETSEGYVTGECASLALRPRRQLLKFARRLERCFVTAVGRKVRPLLFYLVPLS